MPNKKRRILQEDLNCPNCHNVHLDIDAWAEKPHKTHLCLHCHKFFEGTLKGVSHPTFNGYPKPDHILYISKSLTVES